MYDWPELGAPVGVKEKFVIKGRTPVLGNRNQVQWQKFRGYIT